MPRLEVEIGGNSAGLGQAVNQSLGILENLKNVANELKIDLFKATDVASLNAIGNTLTNVTGQITAYTNEAIRGSKAFQDQKTQAVLDQLNSKITVLNGNAQLFGNTITNQQSQVKAYQAAINALLANGLDPMDSKITTLKSNVDSLTRSIEAAKNPTQSLSQQYANTGRIIPDLEAKIKRLKDAISGSTDIRSLAQYNNRLVSAQAELDRLRRIGVVTGDQLTTSANAAANAARRLSGGYNSVGLEFGRIIQDAPFAANNFGAIGNNITRLVEVIPGYIAQQRAIIIANGGVATSNAVLRSSLASIFTGFGGVTIAISAIVSAFTFYQQYQQKVKRETDALTQANVNFIDTLHGVTKAQLQGSIAAQQDITNLRLLYKAYQDATIPLKERKAAYEQIQQLYPEYFKNIAFEEVASGRTKKAYDELTGSILRTARASKYPSLMGVLGFFT